MEYLYVKAHIDLVNGLLERKATDGWLVHTFNRVHGATHIDILFERTRPDGI